MIDRYLLTTVGCITQVLVGWFAATGACAAEEFMARAMKVSDGDTLWVQPVVGGELRKLRLLGIDAPEVCQNGGVVARDALRQLVAGRSLRVAVNFSDVYARGLARIEVNGEDVGKVMVRSGQAWSSRWKRRPGPYAAEEAAAKKSHLGLFSEVSPERPSDFRQRHGSCYPTYKN